MREFDEQERLIVRQLVRDPRGSDNGIGEITGVNVRTVGRKRQRMEQEGILSYHTQVNLAKNGTGQFTARHVYVIKFRIGVTVKQISDDILREPFVRSIFTEIIFESHIAEIDGKVALLLFIDGASDTDIVQTVQEKLIPSLLRNHGENSIEEVSTIRLLAPVRVMRNYLPFVNMEHGYIRKDWPDEAIYVGQVSVPLTCGRLGITPEDFQEGAVLLQLAQGLDQRRVLRVAVDIDEKEILPRLPLRGAALDLAHVDPQFLERLQGGEQRAGLVLHAEHHRGLVVPGGRAAVRADNQEPRRVVRAVLHAGFENFQAVDFRRHAARPARPARSSCEASSAARVVLETSTSSTSGRFWRSHWRHCPKTCGCE